MLNLNPKTLGLILVVVVAAVAIAYTTTSVPPAGEVSPPVSPPSPLNEGKGPTPPPPPPSTIIPSIKGALSLIPASQEAKVKDTITLEITIDTANKPVAGADIVLQYDPNLLSFVSPIDTKGGVLPTIILPKAQTKGTVLFSALEVGGKSFSGTGGVGKIKFKALKSGTAQVTFKRDSKNATQDSNIALYGEGKDILNVVNNATITIK